MMKDKLERLIVMGTSDQYSNGIYEARKDYQKIAGEIYEDDKSYESQMALFLEWYVFDRVDIDTDRTIIETIINESRDSWPLHLLQIYEGFATNIYGLFGIKKIRSDSITVINLFVHEKIIREGRAAHTLLAQKLSYMHLIWERSRQIDLNDIYRN